MRRRDFVKGIAGSTVGWPLTARAQRGERVRRIAWLGAGRADEPSSYLDSLRTGLRDLGWIEGRNLTIERFWATGLDNMDAAALDLLASDPEVIVAQEFTVLAFRSVKTEKPVVFGFSGDPLDVKLVESWARLGGNFTGMSYLAIELVGKRIELLKEWLPQTQRIAVFARPQHPGEHLERKASEAVAAKLGIELSYFPYNSPVLPTREANLKQHSARLSKIDATRWSCSPIPHCTRSAITLPGSHCKPSYPLSQAGLPLPTRDC
jgi:putative ABC transport system substrate-binding protein